MIFRNKIFGLKKNQNNNDESRTHSQCSVSSTGRSRENVHLERNAVNSCKLMGSMVEAYNTRTLLEGCDASLLPCWSLGKCTFTPKPLSCQCPNFTTFPSILQGHLTDKNSTYSGFRLRILDFSDIKIGIHQIRWEIIIISTSYHKTKNTKCSTCNDLLNPLRKN